MAEERATCPSQTKIPSQTKRKPQKLELRYKDAYNLRSASGWKEQNLKLLNAELDKEPGELHYIIGPEYFPSDEDGFEFGQRMYLSFS